MEAVFLVHGTIHVVRSEACIAMLAVEPLYAQPLRAEHTPHVATEGLTRSDAEMTNSSTQSQSSSEESECIGTQLS